MTAGATERVHAPNLFLVGAMKAGTTLLYRHLEAHPDIYLSPIKEPNHFCPDLYGKVLDRPGEPPPVPDLEAYLSGPMDRRIHTACVREPADYRRLFRGATSEPFVGEASVHYLFSEVAAERIHAASPDARILIVLRDPVDRAVSHYRMELGIGRTTATFGEALRADEAAKQGRGGCPRYYVEFGMYHAQVKRFLDRFGRGRVQVLILEELSRDPDAIGAALGAFLGVAPAGFSSPAKVANASVLPRFPALNRLLYRASLKQAVSRHVPGPVLRLGKRLFYSGDRRPVATPEERSALYDRYHADIGRLADLVGRDLSLWTPTRHRRHGVAGA